MSKENNKKRKRQYWAGMVLLAAMLCGCSSESESVLTEKLIIGCDNYEPYNYEDEDGEPAGMDVELAREACRRIGYEPVFERINWSDRDRLLENGSIDCIWSCYAMDGFEDKYAWVGPYMRSRQVVAVLNDSRIEKISDLEGKNLAVKSGGKSEQLFLNYSDYGLPRVSSLYTLTNPEELSIALRDNLVDACAGYAAVIREALNNDGVSYRFLDEDLSHTLIGVAFLKDGDSTARDKLSEAMKDMLSDGTAARILEEYGVDTQKALGGLLDE